jgi:hypothetical protein
MRGEGAVVDQQVHRGAGDDGRELLHELDRLEEQLRGAIAPHRLEREEDAAVGAEADAVLGERGSEEIATELFEAGAIVGGDPDVGATTTTLARLQTENVALRQRVGELERLVGQLKRRLWPQS